MKHRCDAVYDSIVVGGGPAGTSAAIHLAMRGARVLLAERARFPRPKLCGEFISPECLNHFARLGVTEQIIAADSREVTKTVFYARGGNSMVVPSTWLSRSAPTAARGLSRAEMDAVLLARARRAGVEVLEETQGCGLVEEKGRVTGVRLRTGGGAERLYYAPISIDATGRARSLARRHESDSVETPRAAPKEKRRAPFVAFKAHLENTSGDQQACEIYAYDGGYGGLSAVEGGRSNLCFIVRARDARSCGGDALRVMREIVMSNKRAVETLCGARLCSEWLCVALDGFGRRSAVPADGLIAIGDAASFIDPFTGSGVLMALESGEIVAETISRHLPRLRAGIGYADLSRDYHARYESVFGARLRLCAWLRRLAFAPPVIAEATLFVLGTSATARRGLARATRRERPGGGSHVAESKPT